MFISQSGWCVWDGLVVLQLSVNQLKGILWTYFFLEMSKVLPLLVFIDQSIRCHLWISIITSFVVKCYLSAFYAWEDWHLKEIKGIAIDNPQNLKQTRYTASKFNKIEFLTLIPK